MFIRILSGCICAGKPCKIGEIIDASANDATILLNCGFAEIASDPVQVVEPEQKKEQKKKSKKKSKKK